MLPALLLAGPTQPMTVLPDETPGIESSNPAAPARPTDGGGFLVGTVDTIGGSTYDWQLNGPALRMLVNSPDYGVHALWMFSTGEGASRNMRYNFYDYAAGEWSWIDSSDFMASGVNVYTERTGFGALDADPATGAAVVAAHYATGTLAPKLARDMAPGAGIFEYLAGDPTIDNYAWAYPQADGDGNYHLAMIDYTNSDDLYYSRTTDFANWDPAVAVPPPQPHPLFPSHTLAASKVSGKVAVTWEFSEGAPDPGFYRMSNDGGATWDNPVDIPWPPAFGGDSVTSFHITSIFPHFDQSDNFHIVANVMPFVGGNGYIIPAQLWHWTDNTWSHIMTASCDPENLGAAVGYNAMYACRPSLGSDEAGNLFVAWEQFDSSSVEPGPPERLRANIFTSYSADNGATWAEPIQLTDGGNVTYRFPCILDNVGDEVMVTYIIDQLAGFALYAEGPWTNNPIVVQRWDNPAGGLKAGPRPEPTRLSVSASPNPFSRNARISYALPRAGDVSLEVFDISGRSLRRLVSGRSDAGRFDATLIGCDDSGRRVSAVVYLYKLVVGREEVNGKLTLT